MEKIQTCWFQVYFYQPSVLLIYLTYLYKFRKKIIKIAAVIDIAAIQWIFYILWK